MDQPRQLSQRYLEPTGQLFRISKLRELKPVEAALVLVAAQVDEAVEPCKEQLVADAYPLLDAGHPHAREPDRHPRRARLDVVVHTLCGDRRGGEPRRLHHGLA